MAVLMEGARGHVDIDPMRDAVAGVPGVIAVQDVHVRPGWRPMRSVIVCALIGAQLLVLGCQGDPGYAGRSSREWIVALDDSSVAVRVRATDALRHILRVKPNSPQVIRALIRALADTADAVRMSAGMALAAEGVRAEGAVPALHNALHDSAHAAVRWQAAMILGSLESSAGQTSVPVLAEALSDSDPQVRAAAAEALGKIGAPSVAALPELRALVNDDGDASVRLKAIEALLIISPDTAALRPLTTALADSAAQVRRAAASALGALGPLAAPATAPLTRALSDSSAAVRAAGALALGQIGPAARESRSALLAARRDPSAQVRRLADDALRRIEGDTSRSSLDPHGRRGLQ